MAVLRQMDRYWALPLDDFRQEAGARWRSMNHNRDDGRKVGRQLLQQRQNQSDRSGRAIAMIGSAELIPRQAGMPSCSPFGSLYITACDRLDMSGSAPSWALMLKTICQGEDFNSMVPIPAATFRPLLPSMLTGWSAIDLSKPPTRTLAPRPAPTVADAVAPA
jgi:hypothetical protein